MAKRLLDLLITVPALIVASPVLLMFMLAVWMQDFHSPFYVADRVGRNKKIFRMVKLRSMVAFADRNGVTSTSDKDMRITRIGRLIRAFKLDEVTQLWNVLKGDMSLVGPRPNVMRWGVELYTQEEERLLSVRPGITDYASIVFADEGKILSKMQDPDLAYNQLIRPWKSRLSLFYIDHRTIWLDIKLVLLTALAIVSRPMALSFVVQDLRSRNAPKELVKVASRKERLEPYPPPGSEQVAVLTNS